MKDEFLVEKMEIMNMLLEDAKKEKPCVDKEALDMVAVFITAAIAEGYSPEEFDRICRLFARWMHLWKNEEMRNLIVEANPLKEFRDLVRD